MNRLNTTLDDVLTIIDKLFFLKTKYSFFEKKKEKKRAFLSCNIFVNKFKNKINHLNFLSFIIKY